MKTTLETIRKKYCEINFNEANYLGGGGLAGNKFASNRHEDARNDNGKLTLGEATRLFSRATNLPTDLAREVLEFAVPNMEWHHAGKLPKTYGNGMKRTKFLNAKEICEIAKRFDDYYQEMMRYKIAARETFKNKQI